MQSKKMIGVSYVLMHTCVQAPGGSVSLISRTFNSEFHTNKRRES